eukprot:142102-Pyramimonas_sp.AAC.1
MGRRAISLSTTALALWKIPGAFALHCFATSAMLPHGQFFRFEAVGAAFLCGARLIRAPFDSPSALRPFAPPPSPSPPSPSPPDLRPTPHPTPPPNSPPPPKKSQSRPHRPFARTTSERGSKAAGGLSPVRFSLGRGPSGGLHKGQSLGGAAGRLGGPPAGGVRRHANRLCERNGQSPTRGRGDGVAPVRKGPFAQGGGPVGEGPVAQQAPGARGHR